MDWGYIARWQSDLVNAIKSALPVCDERYHMNNGFQQMWTEIKKLWNYAIAQYRNRFDRVPFYITRVCILCHYCSIMFSLSSAQYTVQHCIASNGTWKHYLKNVKLSNNAKSLASLTNMYLVHVIRASIRCGKRMLNFRRS